MNLVWFMVLKFLKAPPQADRNFRTTTLDRYGFKLNHEVVHKAMKLIVKMKLEWVNVSSSRSSGLIQIVD